MINAYVLVILLPSVSLSSIAGFRFPISGQPRLLASLVEVETSVRHAHWSARNSSSAARARGATALLLAVSRPPSCSRGRSAVVRAAPDPTTVPSPEREILSSLFGAAVRGVSPRWRLPPRSSRRRLRRLGLNSVNRY